MSSDAPTLLIRADADSRIGTGHVMRCLALAQCWSDHFGEVTLTAERLPDGLRERLRSEKVNVRMLTGGIGETITLARELQPAAVVLDGYHFTSDDERLIREAGFPVLALDDYGHTPHPRATWVLNQNLGAAESLYDTPARLLLGSRYAMLRREFLEAKPPAKQTPEIARKILITMGGADPDNVTGLVLETFASIPADDLELLVVIGGSNPHGEAIRQLAATLPHRVTVRRDVTDMPQLMRWADLAITAGGTTTWELAAFGVPMIALTMADNQVRLANAIHDAGLAVNLGWPDATTNEQKRDLIRGVINDPVRRQAMSEAGRQTVDGWGVTRVVQALQPAPVVTLNFADETDCRRVWEWANDPGTRSVSFNPEPILWEVHQAWYKRRLTQLDTCLFLIARDAEGVPVGMIRFEKSDEGVIVSVNMAPESRGKGQGTTVIHRGTVWAHGYFNTPEIVAWIFPENVASKRAFEKAGYADVGVREYAGRPAHRLIHEEQ